MKRSQPHGEPWKSVSARKNSTCQDPEVGIEPDMLSATRRQMCLEGGKEGKGWLEIMLKN